MSYRIDSDLEFLKNISSSDLDPLVNVLIYNKNGDIRFSEGLTKSIRYQTNHPDHHEYWDLIAEEIQCFGANTIATIFRSGIGVPYKEVLVDVCNKFKVEFNRDDNTEKIELNLLLKFLEVSMVNLSAEELKVIVDELNLKTSSYTSQAVIIALQSTVRLSGFAAYQVAVIVANSVAKAVFGQGLKFATNAALTRTIGIFVGPIGWTLTGIWTLYDIAGPAYRVTIPAVIQVSFLHVKARCEK